MYLKRVYSDRLYIRSRDRHAAAECLPVRQARTRAHTRPEARRDAARRAAPRAHTARALPPPEHTRAHQPPRGERVRFRSFTS